MVARLVSIEPAITKEISMHITETENKSKSYVWILDILDEILI